MKYRDEIQSELKGKERSAEEFFSVLLRYQVKLSDEEDELSKLILEICNQKEIDVYALANKAVAAGLDVFRIAHLLQKVIEEFTEFEPDSLALLFVAFSKKMNTDLASGMLFESVRKLALATPDNSLKIADRILGLGETSAFGYVSAIYLGIFDRDYQLGIKRIEMLIGSDDSEQRSIGIRLVGVMPQPEKLVDSEFLELVKDEVGSPEVEVASSAVFSLCELSKNIPSLRDLVVKVSSSPRPELQIRVAQHLWKKNGVLDNLDLICLQNLANSSGHQLGVNGIIDRTLYQLSKKSNFEPVILFLDSWAIKQSNSVLRENKIYDTFSSTFSEISKNPAIFQKILFKWFNSDDYRHHHCVSEVVEFLRRRKVKVLSFSEEDVSTLDQVDAVFVTRKILGYTYDFDSVSNLVFSLLKHKIPTDELMGLVVDVFINHLGSNYLGRAIEFLEVKASDNSQNPSEIKVIQIALNHLRDRRSELKQLELINELLPKLDDRVVLDKGFRKSMAEAMKEAQKGSFVSMFKAAQVRDGKKWFSFMHGKFSTVSTMSHLSESIEMPRVDVLDVVGAGIQRNSFRLIKRGQN